MKDKKVSLKIIGIIAVVAVVLISLAVFLAIRFTGSKNSYRSIQIYELEGKVSIDRQGVGSMDAVENIYLESNDRVEVSEGSYIRLKVDGDKYIMVEENSIFSIVAEGTKEDSKTSINLEQGAITNEIQNKLSKKSNYEVTTPNSVMAVRGTVYRVGVIKGKNSEIYTKLTVFEGEVSTRLITPDGVIEDETVIVKGGKEITIHMDDEKTSYLSEQQDIDYSELPAQCLEFLGEVINHGRNLVGINKKELDDLIEKLTHETQGGQESVTGGEQDSETREENSQNATPLPSQTNDGNVTAGSDSAESPEINKTAAPTPTQGSSSANEEDVPPADKTDSPAQTVTPPVETKTPLSKTYTVTFSYNGTVFGTQTVKAGQTITTPKLAPAASGAWDYDFSKPITEDITIQWK